MHFQPTPQELRDRMVKEQLAGRGIQDNRVLDAMRRIPREEFVSDENVSHAYEDRALSTELGQTISQPYIVAFMTEALSIDSSHRILEIGTGTGYQTAILARLASKVFTLERLEPLAAAARRRLNQLGIVNVEYRTGDGTLGWPDAAPFDRILVAAVAPEVVPALADQLTDGGRMILPVGDAEAQRLVLVEKIKGRLCERNLIGVRFVKLIGRAGFEA